MPETFKLYIEGDQIDKSGMILTFKAQYKFFERGIGKVYPIEVEDRILHCTVKSVTKTEGKRNHATVELLCGTVAMKMN